MFAPMDAYLDLVPGLMNIAADEGSLAKLVRFHTAMGTLTTTTTEPVRVESRLRGTVHA